MARAATSGLSNDDLRTIRDAVQAGRRPRVTFTPTAGQIAGQSGQVVQLNDPQHNEEWLVVRFGRDELPFSPADLQIAAKSPVRRSAAKAPPQPAPELKLTQPPVPEPRKETTMSGDATAERSTPASDAAPRPARRAGRAGRAKGSAGFTVTLAYTDGEWTVAAHQGSKVLAKPYVVRAAEALKMVGMLDVPGVHEAVAQIVAAERAEVEQRAEKLRADLAQVEARLAELREAR